MTSVWVIEIWDLFGIWCLKFVILPGQNWFHISSVISFFSPYPDGYAIREVCLIPPTLLVVADLLRH